MDKRLLYSLLEHEEDIEASHQWELKTLVDEYPYFQAAVFLYLKSLYLHNTDLFILDLQRLSITVADRKALFFFIMSEDYSNYFLRSKGKELNGDKSAALLNAFFEAHDQELGLAYEYNLTHSSLASSDYFTYLEKVEKLPIGDTIQPSTISPTDLKHRAMIDSFIRKSEEEGGVRILIDTNRSDEAESPIVEETEELDDNLFFTETLSKIYIKQRKYEKAYKIIRHLSLNYPKKNVYFADQLSFLDKLIINSKFKDKK